jgi:hypothetical protein
MVYRYIGGAIASYAVRKLTISIDSFNTAFFKFVRYSGGAKPSFSLVFFLGLGVEQLPSPPPPAVPHKLYFTQMESAVDSIEKPSWSEQ